MILKIRSKKSPDRTKELLLPFEVWIVGEGESYDERLASLVNDILVDDLDFFAVYEKYNR